jgi:hypothetical protein
VRHGVHYTISSSSREGRPVGDRFLVPEHFTLQVNDPNLGCLVELDIDNTGPEPACVEVRAKQRPNGPPVSGAMLRAVRVGTYVRDGAEYAVQYVADPDPNVMMTVYPVPGDQHASYLRARSQEKQPSRRIPDEELARVADAYRRALRLGQPPTAAVQHELKLRSRAQAARWVLKARRAGFLGPAPGQRLRGEQPPDEEKEQ